MKNVCQFEIRKIQTIRNNILFDFFINDVQLSKLLNIDRLQDLRFSYFDLDLIEIDKLKFPQYDVLKFKKRAINIYLCNEKPNNQFETDRIVLYRCHCGSDYCGVISCEIDFDSDYFYWSDIRFEDDNNNTHPDTKLIKMLKFKRKNYEAAFKNFLKKYYT
ncbi:hypothetical protein [Flavobacterium sp. FlaQc-48]|uniref:hypothetical protein n=1 Tax=Flavobacterium sp. FlaQc-48 TaxID=3374181 RepID=UPI003757B492